jgi:hypothetical protein
MRINLRGAYISMTKHFLHGSQVSTAFEEMRGKRMPQSVRTHLFLNSGTLG